MAYGFEDDKEKANIEEIADDMAAGKVDKVSGKGLSENNYTNTDKGIVAGLTTALSNKVDKVAGKQLSTNDFTNGYKNRIDEAAYTTLTEGEVLTTGATNYYSASSPYTCPHDGYVFQNTDTSSYGITPSTTLYIKVGSTWISRSTIYGSKAGKIVFVKKGMKIYSTGSNDSAGKTVIFYPFVS